MKNRTGIDFSKHEHRIEIFNNGEKDIRIDHFQIGNSQMQYIQFINTDRNLFVIGDYGHWVFCRPFIPSPGGHVSDGYWVEKLKMMSAQDPYEYSPEETANDIQELLDHGLEEHGYQEEELKEAKEWYSELLKETDDYLDYISKAYRDPHKPSFIDYEDIPRQNILNIQLEIIFDAFDEICRRIEEATDEKYYIQNRFVGNAMLFWHHSNSGYIADVRQAKKFTKEEAMRLLKSCPDKDYIAWPCQSLNNAIKPVVDGQYADHSKAIRSQNIKNTEEEAGH